MTPSSPLHHLHTVLQARLEQPAPAAYAIPGRWVAIDNRPAAIQVSPFQWWFDSVSNILNRPPTPLFHADTTGGEWSRYARIYNLFVRSATAFDHDGDGVLGRPNRAGFNEVGSFMKSLCLLPYIQALGCNTIHLLPITAIGQDGNKGDAGSPYAIRNPYKLDANSAEPVLGLGAEAEFAAFVAAAHHLGMRVVTEFVFRTGSKDSDWVQQHPEWFYWIKADIPDRVAGELDENAYGMPIFTAGEIVEIKHQVATQALEATIPPHPVYRAMFLPPPLPDQVALVNGQWRAHYPDGVTGRIPGAFADWPPDDPQPPWGDVTYLRLYDHPDFNYIAYNTLRMYDTRLARPENAVRPLWDYIINIIPHYQTHFGIDGAMIDMGHALPMPLKQAMVAAARQQDPNFAFWDENFSVTPQSREEGYNAVIGSLPFMLYKPADMLHLLLELAQSGKPIPFFGALESHNTPRAVARPGGSAYVRFGMSLVAFLPTMPFVHNGLEFGDAYPINTGLDFSPQEIARLPSERLPLFSARALAWTDGDPDLTDWQQRTLALHAQFENLLTDSRPATFSLIHSDHPQVWGIVRHTPDWEDKIALLVNFSPDDEATARLYLPTALPEVVDQYTGRRLTVAQQHVSLSLPPWGCHWLVL